MILDIPSSFKELYSVELKSTYPMEIKGVQIEEGETVAAFDNIQIANFNEVKSFTNASGGFDNRARVSWDVTKEVQLNFIQGVFSQTQFALMNNANLLSRKEEDNLLISQTEKKESNEEGVIELKNIPQDKLFIYDAITGLKLLYTKVDDKHYNINHPYKDVIVRYYYNYIGKAEIMEVGKKLTEGYLYLEGRTRIKDGQVGSTKTGIIKIPRLKLISGLSMRLGKNAAPVAGAFSAIAHPTGSRGNTKAMEFIYLDDDIDSDM